jgi:hypothetical protein
LVSAKGEAKKAALDLPGTVNERQARSKHMPNMSDQRRKRIQAKQRKASNAMKRADKAAKRDRNKGK